VSVCVRVSTSARAPRLTPPGCVEPGIGMSHRQETGSQAPGPTTYSDAGNKPRRDVSTWSKLSRVQPARWFKSTGGHGVVRSPPEIDQENVLVEVNGRTTVVVCTRAAGSPGTVPKAEWNRRRLIREDEGSTPSGTRTTHVMAIAQWQSTGMWLQGSEFDSRWSYERSGGPGSTPGMGAVTSRRVTESM
jgi:hypothetical protein